MTGGLLIRDCEWQGRAGVDVRVRGDRVAEIGQGLVPADDETRVEAAGGALLPGLNDHHIHLFSLAAALDSIQCGPPHVASEEALALALGRAAGQGKEDGVEEGGNEGRWLRGVAYHESVAGPLDRARLDRWVPRAPLRVQHRSGALWMLNSEALRRLGLDGASAAELPDGVECGPDDRPTGRLFRLDPWLRERLAATGEAGRGARDLARVGRRLARLGVTGLCDATASNTRAELDALTAAVTRGDLPQRLRVMGTPDLPASPHPAIERGQWKIMLDEEALPDAEELSARIAASHAHGRGVAFHCVTRAELVVAAHALENAGPHADDRIEHASIAPPDAVDWLARLGVAVVTQHGFIAERGDVYARDVEARDRPWLYRGRAFLEAGIPLAGSTDAPFGAPDPWVAMRAAVDRRSADGQLFDAGEALTPEEALALFTTPLERPGGTGAAGGRGDIADLCLLDRPWAAARRNLTGDHVAATVCRGRLVWQRD